MILLKIQRASHAYLTLDALATTALPFIADIDRACVRSHQHHALQAFRSNPYWKHPSFGSKKMVQLTGGWGTVQPTYAAAQCWLQQGLRCLVTDHARAKMKPISSVSLCQQPQLSGLCSHGRYTVVAAAQKGSNGHCVQPSCTLPANL
jgi:hypothetical protein